MEIKGHPKRKLKWLLDFKKLAVKNREKIVTVLALATIIAVTVLIFLPARSSGEKIELVIDKGSSSWQVAKKLDDVGVVRDRYLFVTYTLIRGKLGKLQAGHYMIPANLNIPSVLKIISSGLITAEEITITIPEGVNVAEIGAILEKAGLIKAVDFITPETLALEGYLFPDTYKINKGKFEGREAEYTKEIIQDIIFKMRSNFNVNVTEKYGSIGKEKMKEAMIIASMLEKEVRTPTDMKLVAGIIKKRLALGMDLEIDATIAYGACYEFFLEGKYCDVSKANIVDNIHVDSLYNTYTRKELPAGPISNPGMQAIEAALNPQPSAYLFYLNARDGTTVYSKTGLEHERNRRKYLMNI